MGVKTNILKRVLAIFLCITLIMTSLPFSSKNITAADSDSNESISLTADSSTMDGWQQYFPTGNNVNTENAGAIWTDKSVFTDDSAFSDVDITMNEQDSFLVALSAMGSNISVTGMSASPTDTMLVLDVSGSMNGRSGNNDVAAELAEASNYMISTLLAANKYNRVGVVLYSGDNDTNGSTGSDNAIVVLPLGRYTTRNDIYLTYKSSGSGSNLSETISLNTYVYYEGTSTKPTSKSKQVIGSTYTQKGIILAKDQFTASSNETTIDDPNKGTLKRKPIMVLMSDGAPTYSTTSFTNPGNSEFGNGQTKNTTARDGFLTQLSAAYAKSEIEKKYDSTSLFYTLALGLDSESDETSVLVARNILNPDNNYTDSATEDIDEFWEEYDNAAVGGKVTIENKKTVTKIENELNRYYVDKFFDAEDYGSNMQEALVDAFKDIAKDIQLQSKYFPTYTEANENLSGYVSFIDRIGKYMEVTNVEGISINQTLYRGDNFAKNFGSSTGSLGTINNLTPLGEEMAKTVAQHIGLSDTATAKTLINLAYQNGQLAYNSSTRAYSNYIGWFADADGKYLGFWYDGISESTIPATAAYIMKSYVYLGEVPEEYGMKKSDVMYAIVQLREDMKTKDQRIVFAVPAALMPTITYDVSLDKDDKLEKIETSGAIGPIRLIYKAALREEINKYTIDDVVDSKYIEDNKNADGSVNFYTNQYEVDNFTGYEEVNTYSYFKPSREDERYYYQENAPVYADDKGTLYSGNSVPTGEKYHAYTVYSKNGTTLKTETRYNIIDTEVLATAKKTSGENTWYIPAGDLCRDYVSSIAYKTPKNETGTLPFSMAPFADIYGHSVDETDYYFVVGATLGNNGKLTVDREAGLKIIKELAEGISYTNEDFEFILTNTSNATDNTVYPAYKIDAEGTATDTQVKFVNGVSEGVYLKAGEMIYIAGMTVGDVINVKESETDKYKVETVNLTAASQIDVAIKATEFIQVDFVNAERGKGNVTISTEIIHPFGPDYVVPDDKDSFDMTVTVTLNGEPLKNQSFNEGDIVTDENGQFEITLKDGEELEIKDLPEGTVVKVVQGNPGDGFTTEYFDNGESGDGTVTIEADKTADVKTENEYEYTTSVNPVNVTVEGTVILTGRPWEDTDEFTFRMQKWNSETNEWEQVGTDITVNGSEVSGTNNSIGFDFTDIYRNNEEYSEIGSYLYRIVEIEPEDKIGGVTYDKTVHSFVVEVTDEDMDAALEIKDVYSDGETQVNKPSSDSYEVIVDFENIYSTTGQQDVSIDINKLVVNEKGSPLALPSGFKFGIYDGADLVAESTATDESGFARIVLNYGPEDLNGKTNEKYNYILKEIVPDTKKDGWIYSVEETVITVELESVAGVLKAVVYEGTTRPEGAVTSLSVDVTNTYDPGVAHLSIDFVNKNLIGKSMVGGEFTFGVFKHDQVIRNASTAEITGTNNRAGNVIFNKALSFDKVGVYNYDIVELTGDGNGITADKNTYRVEVTVTDDNGQLKAEYEIENAQGSAITFVNTYEAKPVTNAISGIKELTGRELINDEFTFRLTEALDATGDVASNAKEYTAKNGVSATNPNEGTFTFPEITYDTPGTYYYLITEDTETGANAYGVNYDDSKYVATVVIKDDGSGSLKVASVSYGSASEIRFTNTYHVAGTDVIISGTKVLEGKELSNEEFSFTLYNSDNSWNQGTEVETVKNKADGSFAFNKIDYDTAGTYYYLVKEAEGDKGGVTYDTTVYRVKVVITDDMLGQLQSGVSIYDEGNVPQTSIKFVNKYNVTGTSKVTLAGNKTLNGRELSDGEFNFELYKTASDFSVSGSPVQTETNNSGKYKFELEYTAGDAGNTFYYVAKEKDAGKTIDGVTYSNKEYHITVKVEDNGAGGIRTTTEITESGNPADSLDFTNEYNATGTNIDIAGTKELTGGHRELKANEFTFDIYVADSSYVYSGTPLQSVKNGADGKFEFTDIPLTEAKTYYYVIKEDTTAVLPGVIYDMSEYQVAVTVTDNLSGNLVAGTPVITKKTTAGNEPVSAISFTNKYVPAEASLTIDFVNKTLVGRSMANAEFSFGVFKHDQIIRNESTAESLGTNASDGNVIFNKALTFDKAGTYTYDILELTGDGNGITTDKAVYEVTVTVTDNNGQLEADYEIVGATGTEITFVNAYRTTDTDIVISGTKVLEGKELNNEEFSFTLYNSDNSWNQGTEVETVKNKADGSFAFNKIDYDAAGTHYYIVKEVKGDKGGVTYDATVYRIKVEIADDMLGQLHKSVSIFDGNNVSQTSIKFINGYAISGTDEVKLPGTVVLNGREMQDEEFDFNLYETGNDFNVSGNPIQTETNYSGKFDYDLEYDADDVGKTFYYVAVEKNGGETIDGVTYDDKEYHITVKVEDDGEGGVKTITEITESGNPADSLDFINEYNVTGTNIDIAGTKELTGGHRELKANEFTFEMFAADSSYAYSGAPIQSVKNGADGKFEFTDIPLTEAKTYYYVIKEDTTAALSGVTYDMSEYQVAVTVTDNLRGNLVVGTPVITKKTTAGNEPVSAISFTNKYVPAEASLTIDFVNKELVGRNMGYGEFSFGVFKHDQTVRNESTAESIGSNRDLGNVVFNKALLFDKAGVYYYDILEFASDAKGVTFDETIYQLIVTVTDNNGQLQADYEIVGATGKEITFVNTYVPKPVTYAVSGTKELTGRPLNNGEFTFKMTEALDSGEVAPNAKVYYAKNNVSAENPNKGTFTFPEITYDAAGTYHYIVTEEKETNYNGIVYDSKQYEISVLVRDDQLGNLEVALVDYGGVSEMKFTNRYQPAHVEFSIPGTKVLKGRDIKENEFRFTLTYADSSWNEETSSITVNNKYDGTFSYRFVYDRAGTYYYVIRENKENPLPAVTYDDTVYRVKVTVNDDYKGNITVEDPVITKITDAGIEQAEEIVFANIYTPSPVKVSITGKKKLVGRSLAEGEFTFLLNKADSEFTIDSGAETIKATNKADGTFSFDGLTFSEAGTYYFVISEDNTVGTERVTFDKTKYYVKVYIQDDDGSGKLIMPRYMAKDSLDGTVYASDIVFKNTFTPKPDDLMVSIPINKTVVNKSSKTITPEGFSFLLHNVGTGKDIVVKSDKEGKAKCELVFTENDIGKTYDYRLTEVNDGIKGVKYSREVYNISITISLNKNNKLVASFTKNGEVVTKLSAKFVNEYEYIKDGNDPDENPDGDNNPDNKNPDKDKNSNKDKNSGKDKNSNKDKNSGKDKDNDDSNGGYSDSDNPKTGHESNLHLWFAALAVSGLGIIGSVIGRRKRVKKA